MGLDLRAQGRMCREWLWVTHVCVCVCMCERTNLLYLGISRLYSSGLRLCAQGGHVISSNCVIQKKSNLFATSLTMPIFPRLPK